MEELDTAAAVVVEAGEVGSKDSREEGNHLGLDCLMEEEDNSEVGNHMAGTIGTVDEKGVDDVVEEGERVGVRGDGEGEVEGTGKGKVRNEIVASENATVVVVVEEEVGVDRRRSSTGEKGREVVVAVVVRGEVVERDETPKKVLLQVDSPSSKTGV